MIGNAHHDSMDANTPRFRITVPISTLRAIRNRWLEWSPALKLEQQVRPSHLCFDAAWHQSWLLDLLRQHRIEMRVVRRLELDDPRCLLSELQRRVRIYLERRQRRKPDEPSKR